MANDALQAKAVAGYLSDTLRAKKVAIIHEDTRVRQSDAARHRGSAEEESGVSLEAEQAVSNKVTDFAAFVAKLKAAPPDVLVAVLRDPQLIPLGQQLREAGLSELKVIGTRLGQDHQDGQGTGRHQNAVPHLQLRWSPASSPAEPHFRSKFRAAFNSEPVWGAHYAYDAMYVLAHTLRSVGSADKEARARQAAHHRRDGAGDQHDALQCGRRTALRRHHRLRAARRRVGAVGAFGSVVIDRNASRPASAWLIRAQPVRTRR